MHRGFRRGSHRVILGGLHVLSCPEEAAPHADALAIGDGVQLWLTILRDVGEDPLQSRYAATYDRPYGDDPGPAASLSGGTGLTAGV
jgi:hypothetical protein